MIDSFFDQKKSKKLVTYCTISTDFIARYKAVKRYGTIVVPEPSKVWVQVVHCTIEVTCTFFSFVHVPSRVWVQLACTRTLGARIRVQDVFHMNGTCTIRTSTLKGMGASFTIP